MIDWQTIPEGDFNRVAESLIRRSVEEDNPGLEVKAIDGRGGDGGIDLDSRVRKTNQLVVIYQLKWFREGFSGGFAKARKPQIKRSFESALEHDPEVWCLVVPRNLTPKERSFVRSLQGKREKPKVRYLGAGELDDLLQRFPDLDEWAQRTPTRSALREVGRESAAMTKPADLGTEMDRLAAKVRARSDYWDIDFARRGNVQIQTIVPRREDAAEREPLGINFKTEIVKNEELAASYRDMIEYGSIHPVTVPGRYITHFEQVGPEWWAQVMELHSLEIGPHVEHVKVASRIVLRDADERILAQRSSRSVGVVSGTKGGRLIMDLGGGLELTMLIDLDKPHSSKINFKMDLEGQPGSVAVQTLRFRSAFANATILEHHLGTAVSRAEITPDAGENDPVWLELAEDLAAIETGTGIQIPVPGSLPAALDRIRARVARHILEGYATMVPGFDGFTVTLDGSFDDSLENLLLNGGMARIRENGWELEVLGNTITLPDVGLVVLDFRAVDGESHLEAAKAGVGQGRVVHLKCNEVTGGVLAFALNDAADDRILKPVPWSLTGIREHSAYDSRESLGDDTKAAE